MVNARKYQAGTVSALIALSQGTCYFPDCGEPIVRFVDGVPVNNFETAHVRAANSGGKRFDPSMDNEQRNEFSNLVLLCLVHHKWVDKIRPDDYPTATLLAWKHEREKGGLAGLQGLRDLTEEKLQLYIQRAFHVFTAELDDALNRLESINEDAAGLLRPLITELAESRYLLRGPDPDVVASLAKSARDLVHLQDTVKILGPIAQKRQGLRGYM